MCHKFKSGMIRRSNNTNNSCCSFQHILPVHPKAFPTSWLSTHDFRHTKQTHPMRILMFVKTFKQHLRQRREQIIFVCLPSAHRKQSRGLPATFRPFIPQICRHQLARRRRSGVRHDRDTVSRSLCTSVVWISFQVCETFHPKCFEDRKWKGKVETRRLAHGLVFSED